MKSITSFINESLSKLNLDGIHYSITPYKWNRDSAVHHGKAVNGSGSLCHIAGHILGLTFAGKAEHLEGAAI